MRKLITATLGLLLSGSVFADSLLGVHAGVRFWQQDYGGDFHLSDIDMRPIDIDDDIDLSKETNPTAYVALEHPIPFLPNIKIQRTVIETTQDSTVDLDYEYIGSDFLDGTDVTTDMDLSYDAVILYYEVLDNWITLDLGLAIIEFDGELTIAQESRFIEFVPGNPIEIPAFSGKTPIKETVPLLYTKTEFELPFTGLSVGAELSLINYDGHEIRNLSAYLIYQLGLGFGATLGYEQADINLDGLRVIAGSIGSTPIEADISAKGPFLGLTFHF